MNKFLAVGSVLRIERTSIHDGQGLRTVIFLKGCPLHCRWCSTPESQCSGPEKGYVSDRCVGCGICVSSCPEEALTMSEGKIKVVTDFSKCKLCFSCAAKCPQGAIKKYGIFMRVQDVLREIAKDEVFYFHSGGGVTISGGEPLNQADFVRDILCECRKLGIHTALETSFYSSYENVEKVLPWLNVLYVDLKHLDPQQHCQWVGTDNELILANIQKADESNYPLQIIVRIPMVPGVNDSEVNLSATVQFCRSLKKLKEIELLPYHRLGIETYRNLARDYSLKDLRPLSQEQILEQAGFLKRQGPGIALRALGRLIERKE